MSGGNSENRSNPLNGKHDTSKVDDHNLKSFKWNEFREIESEEVRELKLRGSNVPTVIMYNMFTYRLQSSVKLLESGGGKVIGDGKIYECVRSKSKKCGMKLLKFVEDNETNFFIFLGLHSHNVRRRSCVPEVALKKQGKFFHSRSAGSLDESTPYGRRSHSFRRSIPTDRDFQRRMMTARKKSAKSINIRISTDPL